MAITPDAFGSIDGMARGKSVPSLGGFGVSVFRYSTDTVGTTTVTFSGVNANSEIRIYDINGAELSGIENCAVDQQLTWDVYTVGSQFNVVRIVIVHPDYKIKEFTYLSQTGNQSIPVQQEPDKWYSNPA